MTKIWNFIKAVFQSIVEAKELRAKAALKNNNYHHM
jgi:hypothetical protein